MSWVKNLWNRMFLAEEREEAELTESFTEQQENYQPPFRFPLISDEEIAGHPVKRNFRNEEPVERFEAPVQKAAEVYNFPPREPAAVRPPRMKEAPVQRSVPLQRPSSLASRPQPAQPLSRPVSRTQAAPKPKGRFKPTHIPSPVHGFQRAKEPEPVSGVTEERLPVRFTETDADEKRMPAKTAAEQATPVIEAVAPLNTELEREPVHIEEPLQEPSEKQRDIEPEKPASVEVPPAELQPVPEKIEAAAIPVEPKKREKTLPFNVLMLKSDRERVKKNSKSDEPKSIGQQIEPAAEQKAEQEPPSPAQYAHPEKHFLRAPEDDRKDEEWMSEQGDRLVEALSHFQIQTEIVTIVQGPAVTQFELKVAHGVKVSKIRNLSDDLKLALAAKDIRIQAPIPGKSSIGIEIPNRTSRPVRLSEIVDSDTFRKAESPLEAALGLNLTGKPVTVDLRKMPHGLIAGATGSGKSVCINSLLVSLLYKASPKDLKMLLIDPKMVELAPYNHIPHLVSPVITDVKAATASLKWAVSEMERRYQLFAHTGVRDINRYNKMVEEKGAHAQHLPYILIVIDELADLMMMAPADVEDAICRIAQKARACGIHLIIATQRPSVDVITGLIKANIPTRIAFSVSSQVDSRTILDVQGAERLLGRGDMLYLGNGMSAPVRLQGTFVTDEEIEEVIAHVRQQGEPDYFFKEDELLSQAELPEAQDELFEEACRFILSQGSASTSLLQRKFHIGYNRAARLMDMIEQYGFISGQQGSKAREVLLTEDKLEEVFQ